MSFPPRLPCAPPPGHNVPACHHYVLRHTSLQSAMFISDPNAASDPHPDPECHIHENQADDAMSMSQLAEGEHGDGGTYPDNGRSS